MKSASDYKIELGKIARTILYEDSEGAVLFGLDFDTSEGGNVLILERPAEAPRSATYLKGKPSAGTGQSRIDVAFERTKQYLVSRGHTVKVWPDEF